MIYWNCSEKKKMRRHGTREKAVSDVAVIRRKRKEGGRARRLATRCWRLGFLR